MSFRRTRTAMIACTAMVTALAGPVALVGVPAAVAASVRVVHVRATADPWSLVGLRAQGSTSPTVVRLGTHPASSVTFPSVTGQWDYTGGAPETADGLPVTPHRECGGLTCRLVSRGGMSGIIDHQRFWYLAGVFLGRTLSTGTPRSLDFTTDHNFRTLTVKLGQVFFIGDGHNANGVLQSFPVPRGATRLVLGMPDICQPGGPPDCYFDNSGTLAVSVKTQLAQPGHRFPLHHVVRRGEYLWQIARHFLHRYYRRMPSEHLVAIETRTIYRLNRSRLRRGPRVLYAGTHLLIARSPSDVARPGHGT